MVAGEYFWGLTDPGEGNGISIVSLDGNFDQAIEDFYSSSLQVPSIGSNVLNFRTIDNDSLWGPLYKTQVYVDSIDVASGYSPNYLVAGEYFWGLTDPGEGNGISIVSLDGNFDQAFEDFYATLPMPTNNNYLLNIRAKDNDGLWGPLYKTTLYVDVPGNDFNISIDQSVPALCDNDSITLTARFGDEYTSFLWSPNVSISSLSGQSVKVRPHLKQHIVLLQEIPILAMLIQLMLQ